MQTLMRPNPALAKARVTGCAQHGAWEEFYLTCHTNGERDAVAATRALRETAEERGATLLTVTLFGGAAWSLNDVAQAAQCPVSWLAAGTEWGRQGVHGQAVAVRGVPVERIVDGRIVGSMFEDRWARYLLTTGQTALQGAPMSVRGFDREFTRLAARIHSAGAAFSEVVRTWLYVDRILDCYGELNKSRTAFFGGMEMPAWGAPASTGIGVRNAVGAGAVFGALVVQPLSPEVTVRRGVSPLQGGAEDYGSAFSRVAEIVTPDYRRLLISGTASISADGASLHAGDLHAQIAETMRVVDGMLEGNGYRHSEVVRARAYLKDPADIAAAQGHAAFADLPVTFVPAHICREELLFEIELDAIATTQR